MNPEVHPAADIFPLLNDAALADLVADVRAYGLRESIVLHPDGRILDGRNRLRACQLAGVPPSYRTWDGVGSPVAYVVSLNLHRRHLDESQRAMVAARIANLERGANQHTQICGTSQADAADLLNVGVRSVQHAKDVMDRGDSALIDAVDRGVVAVSTAATITDLELDEQREVVARGEREILRAARQIRDQRKTARDQRQSALRHAAAIAAQTMTADDDQTIHHSPFTTVAATLEADSVALMFTDPPYHDKTLGVYRDLGTVAARILQPGGSLITYTAHHRLPEILDMLRTAGLTFFWPLALVHTGSLTRMTEFGIVVHWKLLVWFVKGPFRSRQDRSFVNDLVTSMREKEAHPWQQSTVEARYYIEALTHPGDLVFDPFCGSGTTAVAAKQTYRRWLSCDVDENAVWIARQRLRETVVEDPGGNDDDAR